MSICEDIWYPDGPPTAQALDGGAELLVNISASPYYAGRVGRRQEMLSVRAADTAAFVGYVNAVGGQDELVFDGQSMILSPDGNLLARGPPSRKPSSWRIWTWKRPFASASTTPGAAKCRAAPSP